MKKLLVGFLALAVLGTGTAHADAKDFYFRRAELRRIQKNHRAKFSTPADDTSFSQTLDHTNAQDMRTFQQRFWVDSSFAKGPNSPVLYYICGEATCDESQMSGATLENAQALGAYAVALEHRYYGKSQPFTSLTADNLKYLTVANALADLAAFQKYAQTKLGMTGKWISIGGSYSGALSAYYRSLYPTLVSGALASSGPVQALENFEAYDRHVTEVAGPECATAMRTVVKAAEDAVDAFTADPTKLTAIKTAFAATQITDSDDFLYVIADVGASAVQYGMRDEFCAELATASPSGTDATIKAYGDFAQKVYAMWGVDALGFSVESAMNLDPNSYLTGFGMRQWMYQSCTEFGFFQNAYHDPAYSVRSARINPAYHRNMCNRLFGINQPVDTDGTNHSFYQAVLTGGSSLLMTNGSNDPWSLLGITVANGNNTNPDLTVTLIQGGAHCDDLGPSSSSDSSSLHAAKQQFSALLAGWTK
jgi:pimeloyl-ACP methyl ester carboxylesterase